MFERGTTRDHVCHEARTTHVYVDVPVGSDLQCGGVCAHTTWKGGTNTMAKKTAKKAKKGGKKR
jgi:hypothetical protein